MPPKMKKDVLWEGTISLRDQTVQARILRIPSSQDHSDGSSVNHEHLTVCGRVPFASVPSLSAGDAYGTGLQKVVSLVRIHMGNKVQFFEDYFTSKKRVGLVPLAHDVDSADDRLYILPSVHPLVKSEAVQAVVAEHTNDWIFGLLQCNTTLTKKRRNSPPNPDANALRKFMTAPYPSKKSATERTMDNNSQHAAPNSFFGFPDSKPFLPSYISQEQWGLPRIMSDLETNHLAWSFEQDTAVTAATEHVQQLLKQRWQRRLAETSATSEPKLPPEAKAAYSTVLKAWPVVADTGWIGSLWVQSAQAVLVLTAEAYYEVNVEVRKEGEGESEDEQKENDVKETEPQTNCQILKCKPIPMTRVLNVSLLGGHGAPADSSLGAVATENDADTEATIDKFAGTPRALDTNVDDDAEDDIEGDATETLFEIAVKQCEKAATGAAHSAGILIVCEPPPPSPNNQLDETYASLLSVVFRQQQLAYRLAIDDSASPTNTADKKDMENESGSGLRAASVGGPSTEQDDANATGDAAERAARKGAALVQMLHAFQRVHRRFLTAPGDVSKVGIDAIAQYKIPRRRFDANFEDIYDLGEVLGTGASALVREATHKETGQKVAVKCLQALGEGPNGTTAQRLRRECALLSSIDHPNVVRYYDLFTPYQPASSSTGRQVPAHLKPPTAPTPQSLPAAVTKGMAEAEIAAYQRLAERLDDVEVRVAQEDARLRALEEAVGIALPVASSDDSAAHAAKKISTSDRTLTSSACGNRKKLKQFWYMVMELASGGDLFDRLIEKAEKQEREDSKNKKNGTPSGSADSGGYTEADARQLVRRLLKCVAYLHDRGIIHRDLKPDNLLMTSTADDVSFKLADFGVAHTTASLAVANGGKPDEMKIAAGTPMYLAPEVVQGLSYSQAVDIWSAGIITYILLCGSPPFDPYTVLIAGEEQQPVQTKSPMEALFHSIVHDQVPFPQLAWASVSPDAKDAVRAMLQKDPSKRPSAEDMLRHRWLRDEGGTQPAEPKPHAREVQTSHDSRDISAETVVSGKTDVDSADTASGADTGAATLPEQQNRRTSATGISMSFVQRYTTRLPHVVEGIKKLKQMQKREKGDSEEPRKSDSEVEDQGVDSKNVAGGLQLSGAPLVRSASVPAPRRRNSAADVSSTFLVVQAAKESWLGLLGGKGAASPGSSPREPPSPKIRSKVTVEVVGVEQAAKRGQGVGIGASSGRVEEAEPVFVIAIAIGGGGNSDAGVGASKGGWTVRRRQVELEELWGELQPECPELGMIAAVLMASEQFESNATKEQLAMSSSPVARQPTMRDIHARHKAGGGFLEPDSPHSPKSPAYVYTSNLDPDSPRQWQEDGISREALQRRRRFADALVKGLVSHQLSTKGRRLLWAFLEVAQHVRRSPRHTSAARSSPTQQLQS